MTDVVERYASLNLDFPQVSEVAHRVIMNSYGYSEKKLINLANNNPELFDKFVLDHLKLRKKDGHDVEPELILHRSWNFRESLKHFLENDSKVDDERKLSLCLPLLDNNAGPWSKVEDSFRNHAAKMLADNALCDLVQIEIPKIGETIQKKIGNVLVSNGFLINDSQAPFLSVYDFAKV